jgi:membrane-associated phospholipid phosphatase
MASDSKAWTPRTRLVWLIVLFAVQLLYIPINRTVRGGVILSLPWDAHVPFWPIWAVPYLLSIVWWMASFIWAAWKMDDTRYRAFITAALVVMLTAYAVYLLYPTYVERPVPEGHSWQIELVRSIYNNDRLYNAFPSAHVYTTMLVVLFWRNWRPRLRWLWAAIAVVVILSTLFTGQHNLLDPIGGIAWACAGYCFGWWWVRRMAARRKEG